MKNVVGLADQEAKNVGRSCWQHPMFGYEWERGSLSRRGFVPSTPRAHVMELVMIVLNMKERNMF
jgi:hypothetical protein